jgi:hypothetical protein
MKKLVAVAAVSLIVLGLGADRASAFGCCKHKCCAAQYNAFSPFCCNTVVTKKCFGLKKCCHVLDCCQPCPQPCCPPPCIVDCSEGTACPAPAGAPKGSAPAEGQKHSFMPPVSSPIQVGDGVPYAMPQGMVQPTGYPQGYGHPQMTPGPNGMVPGNSVPYYWNTGMPAGQQ